MFPFPPRMHFQVQTPLNFGGVFCLPKEDWTIQLAIRFQQEINVYIRHFWGFSLARAHATSDHGAVRHTEYPAAHEYPCSGGTVGKELERLNADGRDGEEKPNSYPVINIFMPLPGCQSPPGLWTIFRIGESQKHLHLPLESWEGALATGILGGGPHPKYSLITVIPDCIWKSRFNRPVFLWIGGHGRRCGSRTRLLQKGSGKKSNLNRDLTTSEQWKKAPWLFSVYRGWKTTQLYRDFN